jgi:hypothetical protein
MDLAESVENQSNRETVDNVIATVSIIAVVLTFMIRLGLMNFVTEGSLYVLNLIEALTVYLLDQAFLGISDIIKAIIYFIVVSVNSFMNFFVMLLTIPYNLIETIYK